MESQANRQGSILKNIGFFLVGTVSLIYAFCGRVFAQQHINLPFLDFPIFPGEILLFVCLVLFVLYWKVEKRTFKKWHYFVFLYFGWLILKAIHGYVTHGPLAFRNAALFYYPLFAVITFYFFDRKLFTQKTILWLLIVMALGLKFSYLFSYHQYSFFVLFAFLALNLSNRWLKIAFIVMLLAWFPFMDFFIGARSLSLAFFGAFVFLGYGLFVVFIKNTKFAKPSIIAFIVILMLFAYINRERTVTLFKVRGLIELYKVKEEELSKIKYVPKVLEPKLYSVDVKGVSESDVTIAADRAIENITVKAAPPPSPETEVSKKSEMLQKPVDAPPPMQEVVAVKKEETPKQEEIVPKKENVIIPLEDKSTYKAPTVKIESKKSVTETIQVNTKIEKQPNKTLPEETKKVFKSQEEKSPLPNIAPEVVKINDPTFIEIVQTTAKKYYEIAKTRVNEIIEKHEKTVGDEKEVVDQRFNLATQDGHVMVDEIMKNVELEIRAALNQDYLERHQNDRIALNDKEYYLKEDLEPLIKATLPEIKSSMTSFIFLTINVYFGSNVTVRSKDLEYGNLIFRLYIWHDMLEDMIKDNAWLGINFGKPQRSKRLEMLLWAVGEWQRDGWITPHNSFFHVIYRAGIVGFVLVGLFFWLFIRTVRKILRVKSLTGIVLVSLLIYWIIIACFLVILELPYNAIPFWSLFGITLAYAKGLDDTRRKAV